MFDKGSRHAENLSEEHTKVRHLVHLVVGREVDVQNLIRIEFTDDLHPLVIQMHGVSEKLFSRDQ